MNALEPKAEPQCFYCDTTTATGVLQPIEGLEEYLECVDEPACDIRVTSRNALINVPRNKCKACTRPVYIANSNHGYRIAIEPEPDPAGTYVLESIDRGELYITHFRAENRPPGRALYRLHTSRCLGKKAS